MNPQEKENRADNKAENREEKRKEKSDKPSRLGKEAKIGAAVILLLLITLATVVVLRLKGLDGGDKKPDEIAAQDDGTQKPAAESNEDRLWGGAKSRSYGNPPPTVVAKAATGKPPTTYESGLNKWQSSADKGERKAAGSRYSSPAAEPSFAMDPPKPPRASRYGDVAADRSSSPDAGGAGRYGNSSNDLRSDPFNAKKPAKTAGADFGASTVTRGDFERSEMSGRASTSGNAAPLPDRRGNSRFEDRSAALLPPTAARETPSYGDSTRKSTATTPVSQYDEDFPRSSAGSDYGRGDTRRHGGSSYSKASGTSNDGKYVIQPGDNYSTISKALYGTNAYFKALADHNRGKFVSDDRLEPGATILTPPVAELQRLYPGSCASASRIETQQNRTSLASTPRSYGRGRAYTVAEGDTLFNIARYELGKASRWAEIYELNRDVLGKDFNYLTPGMKLMLPENEKADVLTSRPGETYR